MANPATISSSGDATFTEAISADPVSATSSTAKASSKISLLPFSLVYEPYIGYDCSAWAVVVQNCE